MKKEVLVSVIIPMYNAQDFIGETLESLIQQVYKNIEVLIVDNASTDNSVEIVESYKDKLNIKVIKCSINSGGPAKPRNLGIDNSTGDYIAFLDSDDIWLPNKLSHQINLMDNHKYNFTCISPSIINENSNEVIRIRDIPLSSKDRKYGLNSLLFRNKITTSSVVISRNLLGSYRFDESKSIVSCEDYLLWLNLFNEKACSFLHISEKLVKYRVLPTSLGNSSGVYLFAARSMLCTSKFLVDNNMHNLMYITVCSNMLRLFKLFIVSLIK